MSTKQVAAVDQWRVHYDSLRCHITSQQGKRAHGAAGHAGHVTYHFCNKRENTLAISRFLALNFFYDRLNNSPPRQTKIYIHRKFVHNPTCITIFQTFTMISKSCCLPSMAGRDKCNWISWQPYCNLSQPSFLYHDFSMVLLNLHVCLFTSNYGPGYFHTLRKSNIIFR